MKYIEKYLEEVLKIKPLGKVTTEEDYTDLSGVYICIDNKSTDIFVSHIDYANWLETKISDINKDVYFKKGITYLCIENIDPFLKGKFYKCESDGHLTNEGYQFYMEFYKNSFA